MLVNISDGSDRTVTEDSVIAIEVFDQKRFKKKDEGLLGIVCVRVGDICDFHTGDNCKTNPNKPFFGLRLYSYGF